MSDSLEAIQQAALAEIAGAQDSRALEQLRVQYLGRKGRVTEQLKQLGAMEPEARKAFGDRVNKVKALVGAAIEHRADKLAQAELAARLAGETIDVTLPGRGEGIGGLHPLTRSLQRIERLFNELGFETMQGPEIEDDFHNFSALNIPESHPARAMHDTFYVGNGARVLRTHTSPVQIRTLQALLSLDTEEVRGLFEELGTITMDCEFCNQQYRFTEPDLEAVLQPEQPGKLH